MTHSLRDRKRLRTVTVTGCWYQLPVRIRILETLVTDSLARNRLLVGDNVSSDVALTPRADVVTSILLPTNHFPGYSVSSSEVHSWCHHLRTADDAVSETQDNYCKYIRYKQCYCALDMIRNWLNLRFHNRIRCTLVSEQAMDWDRHMSVEVHNLTDTS